MRIAVAGGTGIVGRRVVDALTGEGHQSVVLARTRGVDLARGTGLERALDGVDAVIDVANVNTMRAKKAVSWFETETTNLLAAASRAGVAHVVGLSIVGIDRVDLGYYEGKRRQEELLLAAGTSVPTTVLRATQFHEFAGQVLARLRGPIALIPIMRSQPIAAREVAAALVRLATGPAVGRAPELAGPQPECLPDMVRRYLAATGTNRPVLSIRIPGRAGKAAASGALLPAGPGQRGVQTFEQWLTSADGPVRSR